jgi:hypothetical protein
MLSTREYGGFPSAASMRFGLPLVYVWACPDLPPRGKKTHSLTAQESAKAQLRVHSLHCVCRYADNWG